MGDETESKMRLLRYLYGLSLTTSINLSSISSATTLNLEPASQVTSIVTELDALSSSQPCPQGRVWPTAGLVHAWPAPPRDLAVHAQARFLKLLLLRLLRTSAVKLLWSWPKRRDRTSFIVRLPHSRGSTLAHTCL